MKPLRIILLLFFISIAAFSQGCWSLVKKDGAQTKGVISSESALDFGIGDGTTGIINYVIIRENWPRTLGMDYQNENLIRARRRRFETFEDLFKATSDIQDENKTLLLTNSDFTPIANFALEDCGEAYTHDARRPDGPSRVFLRGVDTRASQLTSSEIQQMADIFAQRIWGHSSIDSENMQAINEILEGETGVKTQFVMMCFYVLMHPYSIFI